MISISRKKYLIGLSIVATLTILLVHCPLAQAETKQNRATIRPSLVDLDPGEEQQFHIVMKATRLMAASLAEDVKWAVNGIPGGNQDIGTIDATGLYQAPAQMPQPHEIHICAEAPEAANRYLWATVRMGNPVPSYELLWKWDVPIEGSEHLVNPHGITLDRDGNILISDTEANRVLRYSPQGEMLGELGEGSGYEEGHFTEPRLAEIDADGNIFVADRKSDRPRIQVFAPDGEFLRVFAEKGTGPGHILRAHGLGFDPQQRFYVVDVDNMRVNVYSHAGEFLHSFGKDGMGVGEFNAPHGLAMDANGDLFIPGYYGPTQKFTSDGDFLFAFAHGDPPDNPVYFHSVSCDRWGNVYLTVRGQRGYDDALQDNEGNRVSIMKYNNNGDLVTGLSLSVNAHRESWAVVDDQDRIYCLYRGEDKMGIEVLGQK